MTSEAAQRVIDEITDRYTIRTQQSKEYDQCAKGCLPGGDTRSATYYFPYPVYLERGEGCYVYDCDGNSYIDFHNNYTSLIHGHGHQPTLQAAREQLEKGTILGSPAVAMFEHAQMLRQRMPSLELLRYANSGTEATMFALRAARAYTGKDVIIKMDGAYHGTHDYAEVNVKADMACTGLPTPYLCSRGVPQAILDTMLVAPMNDLNALEAVLKANQDRVAAIILEPMPGGAGDINPMPGYFKGARELADRYGVLLIMDEIITFRLSTGGFQKLEGIQPDLTTIGKIIGGGFAVGAFGGRREIMAAFDPAHPKGLAHSGTFNANNITMMAGMATLEAYDQTAVDKVNALGARLREGFNRAFKAAGITGQVTGLGSMLTVHWQGGIITNARQAAEGMKAAGKLPQLLHMEMLNRGIFSPGRSQYAVSTPMIERQIDRAIEEFAATLEMLRPYVAEVAPQLLCE